MKHSIIPSLSFYLYIAIYFIESASCFDVSPRYALLQKQLEESSVDSGSLIDVYTTLRVIKNMYRDIEDQQEPHHDYSSVYYEPPQQDFMIEIMIVLIGTYEKILGATVSYYLMMNTPMQQNLHTAVARIIAEDVMKILSILSKKIIYFLFNHDMTWQEKVWYCAWIVSMIAIIKIGIDQIPKSVKIEKTWDDFSKISEDQSSFLLDKFDKYSPKRNSN